MKRFCFILILIITAGMAGCTQSGGAASDLGHYGNAIFDFLGVENEADQIQVKATVYVKENDADLIYIELKENEKAKIVYSLVRQDGELKLVLDAPSGASTVVADSARQTEGMVLVAMEAGVNVLRIEEIGEAQFHVNVTVNGIEKSNVVYTGYTRN